MCKTVDIWKCPKCGGRIENGLKSVVNARKNPELKQKIVDQTIFDYHCGSCDFYTTIPHLLTYRDPDQKVMLYQTLAYDAHAIANALWMTDMMFDGEEQTELNVVSYKKRVVPSLERVAEKIEIFDHGLDDRIVELIKYMLIRIFSQKTTADLSELLFFTIKNGQAVIELRSGK